MVRSAPRTTQDPLSPQLQFPVPRPYLYSRPRRPLPPQTSRHTQQPSQPASPPPRREPIPAAAVQHMQNPAGHRVEIKRKLLWNRKDERDGDEGWEFVLGKKNGVIPSESYEWERWGGMGARRGKGHTNGLTLPPPLAIQNRNSPSRYPSPSQHLPSEPGTPTRRSGKPTSPLATPGAVAGTTYLAFPPGTSIHIHQHIHSPNPSQPHQSISPPRPGRFVPLPDEVEILSQGDQLWDRSLDTRHPSNYSDGSRPDVHRPSRPPTPVEDLSPRRSSLEHHREVFSNAEDDAPYDERFADEDPHAPWPGSGGAYEEAVEVMRSLRPHPDTPDSVTSGSESSGVFVQAPRAESRSKLSPWSLVTGRGREATPIPVVQPGRDEEEELQESATEDGDGRSKSEWDRELRIRWVERLVNELHSGESVMSASVSDIDPVRLKQIYRDQNLAYIPLANLFSRPRVPSWNPFWKSGDRRKRQEEELEQYATSDRWAKRRRELAEQAVEAMERADRGEVEEMEILDTAARVERPEEQSSSPSRNISTSTDAPSIHQSARPQAHPKPSPPTDPSGPSSHQAQLVDGPSRPSHAQQPATLPNLSRVSSDSSFCSFGTCSTLSLPPLPAPESNILISERPRQPENVAFRPFLALPPVDSLNEPWVWITHALDDSLLVEAGGQWPDTGKQERKGIFWHRDVYDPDGRKGALGLKWWWETRREEKRARKAMRGNKDGGEGGAMES
ncbi:hypothetical protein IAT38_007368 [Cryptococcus sp. DSM 104549]